MHRSTRRLAVAALALGVAAPLAAQGSRLGTIAFPTSGTGGAQEAFLEGVLWLHSFEYERAAAAFRRAQAAEPGFAMAYWGEAMTYTHPVWNQQDLTSGRDALARLGPTAAARAARAPTARERRWLEAVEVLYGEGTKPRRDTLYAGVMERLVREEPGDLEAKAFYALALLGLNQGVRDTVTYLRAAPWADTVFRANPDHPGAAHYLIHAFDDPIHAARGLEAARAYSKIAPDAAHAQHMTTHIFLALGMWDDVVAQNRIAMQLTRTVPGHYPSWLVYGMLQQGRYDSARELIGLLRRGLADVDLVQPRGAMAAIRAHYLLHTEEWHGSLYRDRIPLDRLPADAQLLDLYAAGAIAYRRRDPPGLNAAAQALARLAEAYRSDAGPGDPTTQAAAAMVRTLGGMSLFLSGSRESGVRALREAARIEDALPMEFGPPFIVEPTHEVLGTMLLELDPAGARAEFEQALRLAPGRSRALVGLVRACVATGDKAAAHQALARLGANWHQADHAARDELGALRRVVERMP